MYARCPACQTTFKITLAQLEVRSGLVRCGICSAIFRADKNLIQSLSDAGTPADTAETEKVAAPTAKRKRSGRNKSAATRRRRKIGAETAPPDEDAAIPIVTELPVLVQPRSFWRAFFWMLGILALLALLAGQSVYFYRNELAVDPSWRPWVAKFCGYAGCELRPLRDIGRIELLQTTIAPHPKYENALRIRATLVNRADFPQPYPAMEVGLTSNTGTLLARRIFSPAQYLETPAVSEMSSNVIASALLDITNPEGKAFGYEIRLVTP
jgi:predicted Zn finger-like uncharacterized protein